MNRRRWNIERIRQRHLGYRYALVLLVLLLMLQPLAHGLPLLNCGLVIVLATFLMVCLTRVSPLLNSRIPAYCLGCLAIALEIPYAVMILQSKSPSFLFTLAHVVAWIAFFGLCLFRVVRALIREPYVTTSVVMGAAFGYLLIGFSGGMVLDALMYLQADSFAPLQDVYSSSNGLILRLPQMILGSFGYLTSVGTAALVPVSLTAQVICTLITITGQLYIAIMIGLILGRFHHRRG
ncbi:MAG: hypothetical protein NTZ53_13570 [Cyanobacteria bacterium]|nr:hypothetical protein [Cyanobacteriota bacterium]